MRDEQFAYVIEIRNGEVIDRILRLDLFRQIDKNGSGKSEFTGGIFHALKHFSHNGQNLFTGKDLHDISHPEVIISLASKAFFVVVGEFENSSKYVSRISLDSDYNLKFVFYLEENTGVFFIITIYKQPKSNCRK